MTEAAPSDMKPAKPQPKPMSRSAKGCLGFAIFVVLLVAIPLIAGKPKPNEQSASASPGAESTKKTASSQQMARLRQVVEAAVPDPHPPEKVITDPDGGVFSASWTLATGDPGAAHKTAVVLNRIPLVMAVRYMDESRLPVGNSGTEIDMIRAIDVFQILAQVIEGDSHGAITRQTVESTVAGLFVDDWKMRANGKAGDWPRWSVQIEQYKVHLVVGRRSGRDAEKDGSVGLFSVYATVDIPIDG